MHAVGGQPGCISSLRTHWRRVALSTALVTGLYGLAAMWTAPVYRAEATVIVSRPPAASMLLALAYGMPPESHLRLSEARLAAVLNSTTVVDEVIANLGLQTVYGVSNIEKARKVLRHSCDIVLDQERRMVVIGCRDEKRDRAREIVDQISSTASKVYGQLESATARRKRGLLDERLLAAQDDLDQATGRLNRFRAARGIDDLPAQIRETFAALVELETQREQLSIQLAYQETFSSQNAAGVRELQGQLVILDGKIRDLEGVSANDSPQAREQTSSGLLHVTEIPDLVAGFRDLERDRLVREQVRDFLSRATATARMTEARRTSKIAVLDPPTLPDRRLRPRVPLLVGAGVFSGIMIGVGWCLLPLWWRRQRWLVSLRMR